MRGALAREMSLCGSASPIASKIELNNVWPSNMYTYRHLAFETTHHTPPSVEYRLITNYAFLPTLILSICSNCIEF